MKKISLYKGIKSLISSFKSKEDAQIIRKVDEVHGFQLNNSDLGEYLSNFLDEENAKNLLNNLNSVGYLSNEIGMNLKVLLENPDYDLYIKSVHDSQLDSIFSDGIRCYGTSSSLSTINPDTIDKIKLNNTITKIMDFPILISNIKGNYGFSQGFNMINGTLILQIPKNSSKNDILYYNEDSNTFNIKQTYIIGFLPVDENQNVNDWILPKGIEEQYDNYHK